MTSIFFNILYYSMRKQKLRVLSLIQKHVNTNRKTTKVKETHVRWWNSDTNPRLEKHTAFVRIDPETVLNLTLHKLPEHTLHLKNLPPLMYRTVQKSKKSL